jgi:hypothetical protein
LFQDISDLDAVARFDSDGVHVMIIGKCGRQAKIKLENLTSPVQSLNNSLLDLE